ncbi:MAG TPA: hypothetical protein V6C58_16440 [Allocoleopsis sp.]
MLPTLQILRDRARKKRAIAPQKKSAIALFKTHKCRLGSTSTTRLLSVVEMQ